MMPRSSNRLAVSITALFCCLFFFSLHHVSNNRETLTVEIEQPFPNYTAYWARKSPKCVGAANISISPAGNSSKDCVLLQFREERDLPKTALASIAGSGNTWIRHLIQQATGIYTGSVYGSRLLLKGGGFPGEKFQDGRVIVVKTHNPLKEIGDYQRVVLLIRNPYDAFVAEFNRQRANKTAAAQRSDFETTEWEMYVSEKIPRWLDFHRRWLEHHPCVYVQLYEDLLIDPIGQIQQLAYALGVSSPLSPSHLSCLRNNIQGQYKRQKPDWMIPSTNLFNAEQQAKLNKNIDEINKLLAKYNKTLMK